MCRVGLATLVIVAASVAAQQTIPNRVTVADLAKHPLLYDGKLVQLRARFSMGFEGDTFLRDAPESLDT